MDLEFDKLRLKKKTMNFTIIFVKALINNLMASLFSKFQKNDLVCDELCKNWNNFTILSVKAIADNFLATLLLNIHLAATPQEQAPSTKQAT